MSRRALAAIPHGWWFMCCASLPYTHTYSIFKHVYGFKLSALNSYSAAFRTRLAFFTILFSFSWVEAVDEVRCSVFVIRARIIRNTILLFLFCISFSRSVFHFVRVKRKYIVAFCFVRQNNDKHRIAKRTVHTLNYLINRKIVAKTKKANY